MTYNLYKNEKGRIKQVPVAQNEPNEDIAFPDPLEAKGNVPDVAPFVLQEQKQIDLIKQNETDQARFQTKKLQNSNYQIVNFQIAPTDSASSASFYINNFNESTAVGSALGAGVMFGTNSSDSDESKYYNIVYCNVRYGDAVTTTSNDYLLNPSYVEFYPMQKLQGGAFGQKIPRQIEAFRSNTGVFNIDIAGTQYGVQSFGVDVYNENAYYSQSNDIKGIRCNGLALKRIALNFENTISNLSNIRLDVEVGIDLNTEGNNY